MESRQGTMSSMDDRELAAQIEAMRDDPAAWGDVEPAPKRPRKSEQRQRSVVVSVRLSQRELEVVEEHATARGLSVSGYLRTAALEAASRPVISTRWIGPVASNSSTADPAQLIQPDPTRAVTR
jgi:predicted DNA binding CopG/RHH family protein